MRIRISGGRREGQKGGGSLGDERTIRLDWTRPPVLRYADSPRSYTQPSRTDIHHLNHVIN